MYGMPREATGGHGRLGYGKQREATEATKDHGKQREAMGTRVPPGGTPLFDVVSLEELGCLYSPLFVSVVLLASHRSSKQFLLSCCPRTPSLALSSLPVP